MRLSDVPCDERKQVGKKLLRRRHERDILHIVNEALTGRVREQWRERGDVEKKEELDDKIYSNKTIYGAHNGKQTEEKERKLLQQNR